MASSPATGVIGVELQAAGENLNTWGNPKLTNTLQVLSNLSVKFLTLAMSGDTTVSETNYSVTNTTEVAVIKLTGGTIGAAANLVIPGRAKRLLIWNNESYTITIKLAATAGIALPAGRWTWVTTDGSTDVYNHAPNHMGTGFVPTLSGDVVNVLYVTNAIAALIGADTNGLVLVSAGDTTASYLNSKLVVSGLLKKALGSGGGNETLNVETALYTASGTNTYVITPSPALASYASGNSFLVLFTNASTGASTLNVSGLGAKALTKNGATAVASGDIPAGSVRLCAYDGTRFQLAASIEAEVTVPPLGLTLSAAKTSGFTAVASNLYPCTFGSSGTITLPSSATVGDTIGLSLGDSTKIYTVAPGGSLKMNGSTASVVFPSNNSYILTYNSTAQGWV